MPDQSQPYRRHLTTLRRGLPPSHPGRRVSNRPRRKIPWYLLAGTGVLVAGVLYLRPAPAPLPLNLAVRSLEVSLDAEALVVRAERVYTAPIAGQARRLVPEGERVRIGTPVAAVVPAGGTTPTTVVAETSGMLTYQVDGLEGALDPAQAGTWTPTWFKALAAPNLGRLAEGRVNAGNPLFKIVDNVSESLILAASEAVLPAIDAGTGLQVRFAGHSTPIAATLTHVEREGANVLLQLTLQRLPEELSVARRARISLIFATYTGKVVPRTAIDVRDGRQGVWVLEGKEPAFTPAKVIGGNAEDVVLETDLPVGTQILRLAPVRM